MRLIKLPRFFTRATSSKLIRDKFDSYSPTRLTRNMKTLIKCVAELINASRSRGRALPKIFALLQFCVGASSETQLDVQICAA